MFLEKFGVLGIFSPKNCGGFQFYQIIIQNFQCFEHFFQKNRWCFSVLLNFHSRFPVFFGSIFWAYFGIFSIFKKELSLQLYLEDLVVLHHLFFAIKNKHSQKHQYEFLCGSSNCFPMKITWDIDHKEKVSLQNGFFCEPSNGHLD